HTRFSRDWSSDVCSSDLVIMITGDHPRTAARIAADLGIVPPGSNALTGTDLDELDEAGFAEAVRHISVFARVAPVHKLRIVDARSEERRVGKGWRCRGGR